MRSILPTRKCFIFRFRMPKVVVIVVPKQGIGACGVFFTSFVINFFLFRSEIEVA